jgi:hypothetical protein
MGQRPERPFPSTTFEWKYVKIRRRPGPQGTARAKRAPKVSPEGRVPNSERDLRRSHHVEVTYRGGPECWWEFRYAGQTVRVPGHLQLHDALVHVLL